MSRIVTFVCVLFLVGYCLVSSGQAEPERAAIARKPRYSRGGNYIPTPIVYGEYLYCGSDGGRLSCFEAKTGKLVYRESLSAKRGAFSASPVGADGKIYFTGEKGDIYVVKAGPEFKLLGVNEMNETCIATPAISQGTLFFRTRHHLVAIAENTTK